MNDGNVINTTDGIVLLDCLHVDRRFVWCHLVYLTDIGTYADQVAQVVWMNQYFQSNILAAEMHLKLCWGATDNCNNGNSKR